MPVFQMITKIFIYFSASDLGDEQIVYNPCSKDGEASPQGLPQLPQMEDESEFIASPGIYGAAFPGHRIIVLEKLTNMCTCNICCMCTYVFEF